MQLMISYSRDDKAWVNELADVLRDNGRHPVWIDTAQLVGGEDWWTGICKGIEQAECVIVILTPKSVGSIYCSAELDYAMALNKPILPLMLKKTDLPDSLRRHNIQFENVELLNIDRTHTRCEMAFGDIRLRIRDGEYQRPSPLPIRPPVPEPEAKAEDHIYEVYAAAVENAINGKIDVAEKLLKQVISADTQGLGITATERLAELHHEQDRARAYNGIVRLMNSPALRRDAERAWKAYVAQYSANYDPNKYGIAFATSRNINPSAVPLQLKIVTKADEQKAIEFAERANSCPDTDIEGKLDGYNEAIRLNPQYAIAYNSRGRINILKGNVDAALADYNQAIHLDSTFVDAYNARGNIHKAKGDLDAAIADYNKAIHLDPQFYVAYNNRGNTYRAKGDLDAAIANYNRAILLNPKFADAYNSRGNIYEERGDLDAAIADYNRAILLNPKFADAYNDRGYIHLAKNDLEAALADFNRAIRLNPQMAEFYDSRGDAYKAKSFLDAAITDYSRAINLNPELAVSYKNRGDVYDKQKKHREAVQDYKRVLELNPKHQYTTRLQLYIHKYDK